MGQFDGLRIFQSALPLDRYPNMLVFAAGQAF